MSQNLKARLMRYHGSGEKPTVKKIPKTAASEDIHWPGWTEAGFKTLKREISYELSFPVPGKFSGALAILVPDLLRREKIPRPEELLFFDLETTGLSGGAGTIAFIAAFGRFVSLSEISIRQYMLLDYPGEADFIESVVKEFDVHAQPVVVSYNGKSFDSQILKNRCLMNGIMTPEYSHIDLLHPTRRLWKRLLPDCSQGTIETSVLGLDRTGDVPGALAPEIWFDFLRSGENRDLLSVCEHNAKDIKGLATLFLALTEIAAEPVKSRKKFRFDEEALAFCWKKALKRKSFLEEEGAFQKYAETGKRLLERAARNGGYRAAIALAIDAEWRQKDPALALSYTKMALAAPEIQENLKHELEKRRFRLEEKRRYINLNLPKCLK